MEKALQILEARSASLLNDYVAVYDDDGIDERGHDEYDKSDNDAINISTFIIVAIIVIGATIAIRIGAQQSF